MPSTTTSWVESVIHRIQTMTHPLYRLFELDRDESPYDLARSLLHAEEEAPLDEPVNHQRTG